MRPDFAAGRRLHKAKWTLGAAAQKCQREKLVILVVGFKVLP